MIFKNKNFRILQTHFSQNSNTIIHEIFDKNYQLTHYSSTSLSRNRKFEKFSIYRIFPFLKKEKDVFVEKNFEEEKNLNLVEKNNNHFSEIVHSKHLQAVQLQAKGNGIKFHVALKKSELSSETGLSLRDLRVIDSSFQNQLPMILARQKAIVINLAHVKAIIMSEKIFIFNPYAKRIKFHLIPDLFNKLNEQKRHFDSKSGLKHKKCNSMSLNCESNSKSDPESFRNNKNRTGSCVRGGSNDKTQNCLVNDDGNSNGVYDNNNVNNDQNCYINGFKRSNGDDVCANLEKKCEKKEERNESLFCFAEKEGEGEEEEEEEEDYYWEEINKEVWNKNFKNTHANEPLYKNDHRNLTCMQSRAEKKNFEKDLDFECKKEIDVIEYDKVGLVINKIKGKRNEKCGNEGEICIKQVKYDDYVNGKDRDAVEINKIKGKNDEKCENKGERCTKQKKYDDYVNGKVEKYENEEEKGIKRNEYDDYVNGNNEFVFEMKMLEIVLEEVDKSVRMNFASMVPEILRVLKMYVSEDEGVLVEDQRRFLQAKNKLIKFEMGIEQLINALKDVLGNDEDMEEMYLTRKRFQKNQIKNADHSEVEEMIENYYRRLEEVANEIDTLKSTLDATSEYLRTVLDSSRNKLMRIDVVLNMATCSLATGGSVAAVFGMNLFSSMETHPYAFYLVSGGITFSSTFAFLSLYFYAKTKKIL